MRRSGVVEAFAVQPHLNPLISFVREVISHGFEVPSMSSHSGTGKGHVGMNRPGCVHALKYFITRTFLDGLPYARQYPFAKIYPIFSLHSYSIPTLSA